VWRKFTLQDLVPIGAETQNYSEVVAMPAGARPKVPEGFSVELVANGLAQARAMRVPPNGDLFLANSSANEIRVYRISSGCAKPDVSEVFATGLRQPYGIAFYPAGPNPEWIYVGNSNGVVRIPYKNGDLKATGKSERIVEGIPPTHHWTRDILFTPDGKRLLLSVASGSNTALDMFPVPRVPVGLEGWSKTHALGSPWDTEEGRANILSFNPHGTNETVIAAGIRNPSGLTLQPATGQFWTCVNERDGLGDDTPTQ
jgi:glucose/arabinose dehydrogenase